MPVPSGTTWMSLFSHAGLPPPVLQFVYGVVGSQENELFPYTFGHVSGRPQSQAPRDVDANEKDDQPTVLNLVATSEIYDPF